MKNALIVAVFLFTAAAAYAQTTEGTPKQKHYTHQAGVQINELLRQIFNFNGNAANTNPYLVTYTINSVRTGWGLRAGIGYNYQSLTNDELRNKTNEFKQRIAAQQTANGMMPYLQYISVNNNWRAAPAVLKSVLEHHAAMLDDTSFANLFKEACRNAGVDVDRLIRTTVPPPTQEAEEGPGFAD